MANCPYADIPTRRPGCGPRHLGAGGAVTIKDNLVFDIEKGSSAVLDVYTSPTTSRLHSTMPWRAESNGIFSSRSSSYRLRHLESSATTSSSPLNQKIGGRHPPSTSTFRLCCSSELHLRGALFFNKGAPHLQQLLDDDRALRLWVWVLLTSVFPHPTRPHICLILIYIYMRASLQ